MRYGLVAKMLAAIMIASAVLPASARAVPEAVPAQAPTNDPTDDPTTPAPGCPPVLNVQEATGGGLGRDGNPPNVMGMTRQEAEQAMRLGGFVPVAEPSTAAADWTVDDQTPTSEEIADCGTTVTISLVEPLAEVPNVVDDPLETAEQAIRDAGLVPVVAEGSAAEPRVVADQDPDATTKVARGSTVTLTLRVPQSPSGVTVPDLRGLTRSAARNRLDGTGLVLVVGGGESGTVSEQDPVPGSVVDRGSSITVTLSGAVGPTDPVTPTIDDTPSESSEPPLEPDTIDPDETGSSSGVLPLLLVLAIVAVSALTWAIRRARRPRQAAAPSVVCVPCADPAPTVEIRDLPSLGIDIVCHHDQGRQEIREIVR
ncbi:PASTA domain-containing protein [Nonomuraea sp. CA-141351]|uniref:PASTA domain-containing protein n=1 Tax=Nonomuraea sp. CA-141351 TaxID=3239996 RepID=UPI003D9060C6